MSKPEINVTPLIDVLLVLLIIFMVVTPVKPGKFEAKIPTEPDEKVDTPRPTTLVVELGVAGNIALNNERLEATVNSTAALTERLKAVFEAREANFETEKIVFIKAPKAFSYGSVARIVDAVKMAGAAPISLQIDRLD